MQTLRTFEPSLFTDELRWRYALANIANDAARSNSSAERVTDTACGGAAL